MNIYTSETEYLKTEVQRLRALVRAQQITIDKLEAQPEQKRPPNCGTGYCSCVECVMGPEQKPVAIEYWLQDTMESGRWVTTHNMAKATAEKILSGDYGNVYPQGHIVEPSPPAQRTWVGISDEGIAQFIGNLTDFANLVRADEREACAKICEHYSDVDTHENGVTNDFHAKLIRQRGEKDVRSS